VARTSIDRNVTIRQAMDVHSPQAVMRPNVVLPY
jgi:hypothetical protein